MTDFYTLTHGCVAKLPAMPTKPLSVAKNHHNMALLIMLLSTFFWRASADTFTPGDVFVSVSNGQVQWYRGGTLIQTLNTGFGNVFTTGMAFDSSGNLYVTGFNANQVAKFDTSGNLLGTFGSGYNTDPESMLFDVFGNAYVGQADGSHLILEFDSAGNPTGSFSVATEDRGSDWIDLAHDQETMFYTSEGTSVKRFDVCTVAQLPDFATGLPGSAAYALRILPNGDVLVADTQSIIHLDSAGNNIQSYDAPGANAGWFALNRDPDGTSFWSASYNADTVYKFDITSGAVLQSFSTGTGARTIFGITVFGELTAARLTCPADVTQCNDPGVCGAIVNYPAPQAIQNACHPVTVSASQDSGTLFPVGTTKVTITATEPDGTVVAQCSFNVTVNDCEAPTITCPADVTVCTDPDVCTAVVNNIDPVVNDNCGATLAYTLTGDTTGSGSGSASGLTFNKGTTTVSYTATDAAGLSASCSFAVTVNDCQPPTVTCSVATSELWPPNHVLTDALTGVGFVASAVDNCEGIIPAASIQVQVFSDEDDLVIGSGSGNFSPDAKNLTATGTLRLRAERNGTADGRVYLIVATATDSSGNTGFCTSTVTVTHDQSAASIASVQAQAAAAQAYAESHNGNPPPGYFLVGDGPTVGPFQ